MPLRRITLTLARTPDFPDGDPRHGYELVAPLDSKGHLDAEAWRKARSACLVRRFAPGADDESGELIRTRGGKWVFSYAPGEEDDEPVFRLSEHRFVQGEYVSVTEHDGTTRPFRVTSVLPLRP
jgi:hypothetical protein